MVQLAGDQGKGLLPLPCLLADDAVNPVYLLHEVHWLHIQGGLAAFNAAHVQNVVDDAQQQPPGVFQLVQVVCQFVRLPKLVFHQRGNADDGVHGRADVMAHIGKEIGFCLAGLFGTPQRLHGNFLRLLQFLVSLGKLLIVAFQPEVRLLLCQQLVPLAFPLQPPENQDDGS